MIERVRGSAALSWGLLFGALAGLVAIGLVLRTFVTLSVGVDRGLSYGGFLLSLALYFLAGVLTVRAGQPVSVGAIAGLLVAVVSQTLAGVVLLGVVVAAPLAYAQSIGQPSYAKHPAALLLTTFMGLLIALMVYGAFGAALGALGGLVVPGKRPTVAPDTDTHSL